MQCFAVLSRRPCVTRELHHATGSVSSPAHLDVFHNRALEERFERPASLIMRRSSSHHLGIIKVIVIIVY